MLVGALAGCPRTVVQEHDAPGPQTPQHDSAMALRREAHLYDSTASGFNDAVRMVVRDSVMWRSVWSRIVWRNLSGRPAVPPDAEPPRIDFNQEVVLVASSGLTGCPEFRVSIDSLYVEDGGALLAVVQPRGALSCGCLGELAAPIDVVRVPRTNRIVRFVERPMRDACPYADKR